MMMNELKLKMTYSGFVLEVVESRDDYHREPEDEPLLVVTPHVVTKSL